MTWRQKDGFRGSKDERWFRERSEAGVCLLPVHTQNTQVEDGDAHGSFLQEGEQLAEKQAERSVRKGPLSRQQLHTRTHRSTVHER